MTGIGIGAKKKKARNPSASACWDCWVGTWLPGVWTGTVPTSTSAVNSGRQTPRLGDLRKMYGKVTPTPTHNAHPHAHTRTRARVPGLPSGPEGLPHRWP